MGLFTKGGTKGGSSLSDNEEFELKMRKREDADRKERSELNRRKFAQTKTARLGNFMQGFTREKRRTQVYAKELAGRPKGSYDKRYAKFGGVYNFRKQQSFQRRVALLNAQKNSQLSPEEQFTLRQLQENKRRQSMAKEFQTIPDTDGTFNLGSFDDEINAASNLVN